jgi:outer membrane protein assembly factor BamB
MTPYGEASVLSSSPSLSADGNTVYVGSGGSLLALAVADGTVEWSAAVGSPRTSAPAVAADGTIFAATLAGDVVAVSPAGALMWHYDMGPSILSSPALSIGGGVVVSTTNASVLALAAGGQLAWQLDTGYPPQGSFSNPSPAVDAAGNIYVGFQSPGSAGFMCLSPNGKLLWAFPYGTYSSPALNFGFTETPAVYFDSYACGIAAFPQAASATGSG